MISQPSAFPILRLLKSSAFVVLFGFWGLCPQVLYGQKNAVQQETRTNADSKSSQNKDTAKQSKSSANDASNDKASSKKNRNPEVEQALAFVREHHEEMVPLLELLQAMNPKQFEAAIKDTNRVRVRLEQLKQRDEESYANELERWTLQSQINLHVAKKIGEDHDYSNDKRLKELLQKQRQVELKILASEKQRISKRFAQIEEQMEDANRDPDQWVMNQIGKLSKKAATQQSKVKKKSESRSTNNQ